MNYSRLADIRSHMGPKHTLGFINSFSSSISLFKSNHTCISVADAIQKKWDVIIWYFSIISSDKVLRSLYSPVWERFPSGKRHSWDWMLPSQDLLFWLAIRNPGKEFMKDTQYSSEGYKLGFKMQRNYWKKKYKINFGQHRIRVCSLLLSLFRRNTVLLKSLWAL